MNDPKAPSQLHHGDGSTYDHQLLARAGLPTIEADRLVRLHEGAMPIISAVKNCLDQSLFHGFDDTFAQALEDCATPRSQARKQSDTL